MPVFTHHPLITLFCCLCQAFAAYGSGASSRGESPARYGSERSHSRQRPYAGGEMARKVGNGETVG